MHARIITGLAMIATIGMMAIIVFMVAVTWATIQSRERAGCYRTATSIDACGKPSTVERTLWHYIAHVDL